MSDTLLPDRDMMLECLEAVYGQAMEGHPALAFNRPGTKLWPRVPFDLAGLEEAVDLAYERNMGGENVYFCPALVKEPKPTVSDTDFLAAWALIVDLDAPGSPGKAAKVCRDLGCLPTFATVTGRYRRSNGHIEDHLRQQLIWLLTDGCRDGGRFRTLQRAMCSALGGDMAATNLTRLFRVGGSLALPNKEGRVEEQTEIHKVEGGRLYDIEELERLFPAERAEETKGGGADFTENLHTGALNADLLLDQMFRPGQWHESALRWTGRLVNLGLTDKEIAMVAPAATTGVNPHTGKPYSVGETLADIKAMVSGARSRWGVDPDNVTGFVEVDRDAVPTDLLNNKAVLPEWPAGLLPWPFADHIDNLAEAIGCPPDFAGVSMLAALATAAGKQWQIKVNHNWIERVCVWGAMVAASGSAKTPAMKSALGPLYAIEAELKAAHKERLAEYELELERFELDLTVWRKAYKNGEAGDNDRPTEPEHPGRSPVLTMTSSTQEEAAYTMSEQDNGFLLVQDELAGWFSGLNQYRAGADREFWLSVWSFAPYTHYRRDSKATFSTDATYANMIGGIQPGLLGDVMLKGPIDGMTARFNALVYPKPRKLPNVEPGAPDPEIGKAVRRAFQWLHRLQQSDVFPATEFLDDAPEGSLMLRFGPAARERFYAARARWMNQAQDMAAQGNDAIGAHMSKYPGFLARLCGLVHLLRVGAGREVGMSGPETTYEIGDDVVAECVSAIDDYFWPHAKQVYREYGSSDTDNLVLRLAVAIRKGVLGQVVSVASVRRRNWRGLKDRKTIIRVLEELEAALWIIPLEAPRKRPGKVFSQHWVVNERVYAIELPDYFDHANF